MDRNDLRRKAGWPHYQEFEDALNDLLADRKVQRKAGEEGRNSQWSLPIDKPTLRERILKALRDAGAYHEKRINYSELREMVKPESFNLFYDTLHKLSGDDEGDIPSQRFLERIAVEFARILTAVGGGARLPPAPI